METDPAPTATLQVDRTTIEYGESIRLEWQTRNADRVTISDGGEELLLDTTAVLSGKRSISPCVTTTFVLTAEGLGGTATAIVYVDVEAAIFSFGPTSTEPVVPGSEVELAWTTMGAEALLITTPDGESYSVPKADLDVGKARVKAGLSGTFTLTAQRGNTWKTSDFSVGQVWNWAPVITSFDAASLEFEPGRVRFVDLVWSTVGASSVSLSLEPGGPVDLSGRSAANDRIEVQISQPTRAIFSATNAAGTVRRVLAFTPSSGRVGPVIETFNANKSDSTYLPGDPIGFSWTVQGGTALYLLGPDGRPVYEANDPDGIGRSGSTFVSASEEEGSYVYTLWLTNGVGETTTRTIEVQVDTVAFEE
ncbi:hypothetical protein [Vulgatibacter incomptus]|uniref:hypothetical protein n=1 Tax=Vulgatibacter incomptus TaxID=1391653 RepID=UPI0012F9E6E6|nr:hypothetical protein [Vulgatibacter incomptus]